MMKQYSSSRSRINETIRCDLEAGMVKEIFAV